MQDRNNNINTEENDNTNTSDGLVVCNDYAVGSEGSDSDIDELLSSKSMTLMKVMMTAPLMLIVIPKRVSTYKIKSKKVIT